LIGFFLINKFKKEDEDGGDNLVQLSYGFCFMAMGCLISAVLQVPAISHKILLFVPCALHKKVNSSSDVTSSIASINKYKAAS
jgi:hypothetical protein